MESDSAFSSISSALAIVTFAGSQPSAAAASVAQTRRTFRRPRNASRTGLRP